MLFPIESNVDITTFVYPTTLSTTIVTLLIFLCTHLTKSWCNRNFLSQLFLILSNDQYTSTDDDVSIVSITASVIRISYLPDKNIFTSSSFTVVSSVFCLLTAVVPSSVPNDCFRCLDSLIPAPLGARAYPWILSKYFLSVRPSVHLSVCPSVCPCVRPFVPYRLV